MAEISAKDVAALRKITGAGMMDCKKALLENDGDFERAKDWLREKGIAGAAKREGRAADQGAVEVLVAGDVGVVVELNCETDFVAKNEDFRAFAAEVGEIVARRAPADVGALSNLTLASGDTVEARRVALVQKIGENIALRRFVRTEGKGRIASYVHHSMKIGVLVDVTGGADTLGKDLAMHIAALKPVSIDKSAVSADVIAKEREIAAAQVAEDGKTGDMAAKIIEGKVNKAVSAMTLAGQAFVKGDSKQTVEQLLKAQGATVNGFVMYAVGEGIEKKKDDFAGEVAAMTKPRPPLAPGAVA
jgi:elongation factor Ts